MYFYQSFLYGSANDGVAERAFEQFRNNSDYVNSHGVNVL